MLKWTDHSGAVREYLVSSPVLMFLPASQKTFDLGVCRSNQAVWPSALQNSWPEISMGMDRLWICVRPVPSVWTIQGRSTTCQGPSWANMRRVGSVGLNWTWLSQSVLRAMRLVA